MKNLQANMISLINEPEDNINFYHFLKMIHFIGSHGNEFEGSTNLYKLFQKIERYRIYLNEHCCKDNDQMLQQDINPPIYTTFPNWNTSPN